MLTYFLPYYGQVKIAYGLRTLSLQYYRHPYNLNTLLLGRKDPK